jgi:hypothetical protein
MKSGMQNYFFLASFTFRSKALVIVKKIRDPDKNSSRIQGGKKHQIPDPDPQHCRYLMDTGALLLFTERTALSPVFLYGTPGRAIALLPAVGHTEPSLNFLYRCRPC